MTLRKKQIFREEVKVWLKENASKGESWWSL